jgi:hypothetical protein
VPASSSRQLAIDDNAHIEEEEEEETDKRVPARERMVKAVVFVHMLTGTRQRQPRRFLMRVRFQRGVVDLAVATPGAIGWKGRMRRWWLCTRLVPSLSLSLSDACAPSLLVAVQSVVKANSILAAYAQEDDEKYLTIHTFQLDPVKKKRTHAAMR